MKRIYSRSSRLDYIYEEVESKKVDSNTLDQDSHTLRDIIFNHINLSDYESDFIHLNDKSPTKILEFIKETKLAEIGLDKHTAYRKLINIKFDSKCENANNFVIRYGKAVRTYGTHSESGKFPDDEKRKLFHTPQEIGLPIRVKLNRELRVNSVADRKKKR